MFKKYLTSHYVSQPYSAPSNDNDGGVLTAAAIEDALSINDDAADDADSNTADDEKITPDHLFSLKDDEDKETKDDDKEVEDKEIEDDEKTELKLDEVDEDELELAKVPTRQQIKAYDPELFKKFPALEHVIYREHAYAEVFPTVKDAKDARESINQFNQFQSELLDGNIETLLKSVKSTDAKAFSKITENLLDTLIKIDPNSHLGLTHQVSKGILNYIHSAATSSLKKNPEDKRAQQLQIASELIHEALYDTSEVTPFAAQKRNEENPEATKLKTERDAFERTKYETAFNTVSSKVKNLLTNAVARDIDTKNILPPYVKNTVVKDVMGELDRQLVGDTRFRNLVDKLWLKAKEANFSESSLNNIQTALKEKAKTILPSIMRAKRGEAMKGLSVKRQDEKPQLSRNNDEERAPRKITATRRDDDRNVPKPGERAIDFLMRD